MNVSDTGTVVPYGRHVSGLNKEQIGAHTTGRVSQVATMRSVIQRYQAGDSSMRGRNGPSMKTLPKKLAKNRVTTKYRPRTDTAICGEEGDEIQRVYRGAWN